MRETRVERSHTKNVKERGGKSYKFESPGYRSVPDRIDLYPVAPEDRATVAKYLQFTELKAPGETPEAHQKREHARLRKMGFKVNVIDNV